MKINKSHTHCAHRSYYFIRHSQMRGNNYDGSSLHFFFYVSPIRSLICGICIWILCLWSMSMYGIGIRHCIRVNGTRDETFFGIFLEFVCWFGIAALAKNRSTANKASLTESETIPQTSLRCAIIFKLMKEKKIYSKCRNPLCAFRHRGGGWLISTLIFMKNLFPWNVTDGVYWAFVSFCTSDSPDLLFFFCNGNTTFVPSEKWKIIYSKYFLSLDARHIHPPLRQFWGVPSQKNYFGLRANHSSSHSTSP